MSRKYITHVKSVQLMASIRSPDTDSQVDGFGHDKFRFFLEAGMFCIESKRTGRVADVPTTMLRSRQWFTDKELEANLAAEQPAS